MAGRAALGVLLAVAAMAMAALLVAADDDKTWKCFRPCSKNCHRAHHHHDNGSATVAADFFPSGSGDANKDAVVASAAVSAECHSGCQDDACFKDLPPISPRQCAIAACLSHQHHSRKITACLKGCCDKCFRGQKPPVPGPPAPSPSPPEPSPPAPEPGPGPTPPSPSN